jgi:ubiquinone/menaquinone biosynthesis C-methylase UbiE
MPHRFEAQNKHMLEDEERTQRQPAEDIVKRAAPTLDEVCADLGCGTGYLSLPFALKCRALIAVDSQREMLDALLSKASGFTRMKIFPVLSELPDLPFSGACLDRVLLVNTLHEVEDREKMAWEVERTLRGGGKLSLVDFQKKATGFGPPVEERIKESDIPGFFPSMKVERKWSFDSFYQFELVRL